MEYKKIANIEQLLRKANDGVSVDDGFDELYKKVDNSVGVYLEFAINPIYDAIDLVTNYFNGVIVGGEYKGIRSDESCTKNFLEKAPSIINMLEQANNGIENIPTQFINYIKEIQQYIDKNPIG